MSLVRNEKAHHHSDYPPSRAQMGMYLVWDVIDLLLTFKVIQPTDVDVDSFRASEYVEKLL